MSKHRCDECGRVSVKWSKQRILAAAKAWHETHGFPPSSVSWERASEEHPGRGAVLNMFGTWAEFLRAAGLRADRNGWTREQAIDALTKWVFVNRRLPGYDDWRQALSDNHPSSSQILGLFGSWNAFIVASGYEPKWKHRTTEGYRRQAARAAA